MQKSNLIRQINDGHYETDGGAILLPQARILAQGVYRHWVNGQDMREDSNIVVTEFLNYLLSAGVKGGSADSAWFMALYSANYSPVATLTAASFTSTTSEITSGTEGYTETTRQAWTAGSVASGQVDSYSSRATFTIATASTLSVNGVGILSDSAKGATTGTLMSAVKFSSTRSLQDTDSFAVGYRITLTPV